jgi:hypothetical protein
VQSVAVLIGLLFGCVVGVDHQVAVEELSLPKILQGKRSVVLFAEHRKSVALARGSVTATIGCIVRRASNSHSDECACWEECSRARPTRLTYPEMMGEMHTSRYFIDFAHRILVIFAKAAALLARGTKNLPRVLRCIPSTPIARSIDVDERLISFA